MNVDDVRWFSRSLFCAACACSGSGGAGGAGCDGFPRGAAWYMRFLCSANSRPA